MHFKFFPSGILLIGRLPLFVFVDAIAGSAPASLNDLGTGTNDCQSTGDRQGPGSNISLRPGDQVEYLTDLGFDAV